MAHHRRGKGEEEIPRGMHVWKKKKKKWTPYFTRGFRIEEEENQHARRGAQKKKKREKGKRGEREDSLKRIAPLLGRGKLLHGRAKGRNSAQI